MFSKLLEFLPKKRSKEIQASATADTPSQKPTQKKGWSSADMVMVGGLIAIMGGMFWVMSGSSEAEKPVANPAKENVKKEEGKKAAPQTPFYEEGSVVETKKDTPIPAEKQEQAGKSLPFVYPSEGDFESENLMPPPEAYDKNNTMLAKKSVTAEKEKVATAPTQEASVQSAAAQEPAVPKTQEVTAVKKPLSAAPSSAPQTQKPAPEAQQSYVCHVMPRHTEMIGKEIMYYTKDTTTHKYLPAHSKKNWDESGVWIKEKLIASQVDIDERMAEISTGKWIPALEFMTCTLVEEVGR